MAAVATKLPSMWRRKDSSEKTPSTAADDAIFPATAVTSSASLEALASAVTAATSPTSLDAAAAAAAVTAVASPTSLDAPAPAARPSQTMTTAAAVPEGPDHTGRGMATTPAAAAAEGTATQPVAAPPASPSVLAPLRPPYSPPRRNPTPEGLPSYEASQQRAQQLLRPARRRAGGVAATRRQRPPLRPARPQRQHVGRRGADVAPTCQPALGHGAGAPVELLQRGRARARARAPSRPRGASRHAARLLLPAGPGRRRWRRRRARQPQLPHHHPGILVRNGYVVLSAGLLLLLSAAEPVGLRVRERSRPRSVSQQSSSVSWPADLQQTNHLAGTRRATRDWPCSRLVGRPDSGTLWRAPDALGDDWPCLRPASRRNSASLPMWLVALEV